MKQKAAVKQIRLDITSFLDEKQRCIRDGSAAAVLGRGGISFVNEVTGSARNTITSGMKDIAALDDTQDADNSNASRRL